MDHFISAQDAEDITQLVSEALTYKANPFKDKALGTNKTIGLLFFNPSMRTRISTQVAAKNLGMETIVFNIDKEGWQLEFEDGVVMNGNKAEHIKEAAAVMGSYFDLIAVRTFPGLKNREEDYSEHYIKQFKKHAGVPILSMESATLHPLQSLADLVTISELFALKEHKPKVVMTWAPHIKALPQSVPNSFAQWATAWNQFEFTITHPRGYELDEQFTHGAQLVYDQEEAFRNADFIYVKNWSSYHNYGEVKKIDRDWMVTLDKLQNTNNAKVMHCLPVRRNVVIADDVMNSDHAVVIREAGNRVWAAQAVMAALLK